MHMRTTLNIDDEPLARARKLIGIKEKTALAGKGLEALIALESARRLAALADPRRNSSRRRGDARDGLRHGGPNESLRDLVLSPCRTEAGA